MLSTVLLTLEWWLWSITGPLLRKYIAPHQARRWAEDKHRAVLTATSSRCKGRGQRGKCHYFPFCRWEPEALRS